MKARAQSYKIKSEPQRKGILMSTLVKKTTEELQIDCEVASEVLAECLALYAKELAEERDLESPNPAKIEALEKRVGEIKQLRMSLSVENTAAIDKVLFSYAPLLKKRVAK